MKRSNVPKKRPNESEEGAKKPLKQQKLPFTVEKSDSSENPGGKINVTCFCSRNDKL